MPEPMPKIARMDERSAGAGDREIHIAHRHLDVIHPLVLPLGLQHLLVGDVRQGEMNDEKVKPHRSRRRRRRRRRRSRSWRQRPRASSPATAQQRAGDDMPMATIWRPINLPTMKYMTCGEERLQRTW